MQVLAAGVIALAISGIYTYFICRSAQSEGSTSVEPAGCMVVTKEGSTSVGPIAETSVSTGVETLSDNDELSDSCGSSELPLIILPGELEEWGIHDFLDEMSKTII